MNKDPLKGYTCECCGQYVKMYRRSFNSNMAVCLLLLYKFNMRGWVKVEDFLIKNGQKRCGDFSYLVHYGFLEKQIANREDGSSRNGYYKMTGRGMMFCEGKINAHKHFLMLNGKFMGFEGDEIDIKQALGKKFNFDELMGNFNPRTGKDKETLKQLQLL